MCQNVYLFLFWTFFYYCHAGKTHFSFLFSVSKQKMLKKVYQCAKINTFSFSVNLSATPNLQLLFRSSASKNKEKCIKVPINVSKMNTSFTGRVHFSNPRLHLQDLLFCF